MIKFNKGYFKIATDDGEINRPGYVSEKWGIDRRHEGLWYVNHLPSKKLICPWAFKRLKDAKHFTNRINELNTWDGTHFSDYPKHISQQILDIREDYEPKRMERMYGIR